MGEGALADDVGGSTLKVSDANRANEEQGSKVKCHKDDMRDLVVLRCKQPKGEPASRVEISSGMTNGILDDAAMERRERRECLA